MENLMTLGVIFSEKEPPTQKIFKKLVGELNEAADPFPLYDFDGREITCTVRTVAVVLDWQSLWSIAEMSPYGPFPCNGCPVPKDVTERLVPSNGGKTTKFMFPLSTDKSQVPPPEPGARDQPPHPHYRTKESWLFAAEVAVETRDTFLGINGPCELQELRHFRFPDGIVADPMHFLYEHLVPEFRQYWFNSKYEVRWFSLYAGAACCSCPIRHLTPHCLCSVYRASYSTFPTKVSSFSGF